MHGGSAFSRVGDRQMVSNFPDLNALNSAWTKFSGSTSNGLKADHRIAALSCQRTEVFDLELAAALGCRRIRLCISLESQSGITVLPHGS